MHPPPPPSPLPSAGPPDTFAALRAQCDDLVSSEHVDKGVALGILKLFHTAETAMLALRFGKDQEIDRLRHEVQLMQAARAHAEMLESLSSDVRKLKEDSKDVRRLSEQAQQTATESLTMATSVLPAKRR